MSSAPLRSLPVSSLILSALLVVATACGDGGAGPAGPSPGITLQVQPTSLTVVQGEEIEFTVSITRTGGYEGPVVVAVLDLPAGVVVVPGAISSSETSDTLTLAAAPDAELGATGFSLTATGNGVGDARVAVPLTVEAPPSFALTVDPAALSLEVGTRGTVDVGVDRTGGYQGVVELTVTGGPPGLQTTLTDPSVTGNGTELEIAAATDLPAGDHTLTVSGTGDGTDDSSAQLQVTITEVVSGSFTLTVDPAAITLASGASGSSTIRIQRSGGFTGPVDLSLSPAPSGLSAVLGETSVATDATPLEVSADPGLAPGVYALSVTGTTGSAGTATADLTITVEAAATFSLSLDPSSLTVEPGGKGTAGVVIDRSGGFGGLVELVVSGTPPGLETTLGSAAVAGDGTTLEVTADPGLGDGSYAITVTGSGAGTGEASATLGVTVASGPGEEPGVGWTFCSDPPEWFAMQDGPGAAWTRILPTGTTFPLPASSDRVGVAFVQVSPEFTGLYVYLLERPELDPIGETFCNVGTRTVDVEVTSPLAADEVALLGLGSSYTTVPGPGGANRGVFEQVPDGPLNLFGSELKVDPFGGGFSVERMYLRRGLTPADGSQVELDFDGAFGFDPLMLTVTLQNLDGDLATVVAALSDEDASVAPAVTVPPFPEPSPTRPFASVPPDRLEPGDLQFLIVNATEPGSPFLRQALSFFAGSEDQQVELGPDFLAPTLTFPASSPYLQPRIQATIQPEYDDGWSATFSRDGLQMSLQVSPGWIETPDFDVSFPDLSAAEGWSSDWALQGSDPVFSSFSGTGWNGPGVLGPSTYFDGLLFRSGGWLQEVVP